MPTQVADPLGLQGVGVMNPVAFVGPIGAIMTVASLVPMWQSQWSVNRCLQKAHTDFWDCLGRYGDTECGQAYCGSRFFNQSRQCWKDQGLTPPEEFNKMVQKGYFDIQRVVERIGNTILNMFK